MRVQSKMRKCAVAALCLSLVAGCGHVPTYPSVLALPGSGKSFEEFRASDIQCRNYAFSLVNDHADETAVRHALVGTAIGAVAGAAIGGRQGAAVGAGSGLLLGSASGSEASRSYGFNAQQRYDTVYVQCMYASGHKVPVPASAARNMVQRPVENSVPPPPGNLPLPSVPPDYVPSPVVPQ